jgi:hypothetical protein
MKLIFDASTEHESFVAVVDIDIDGLKDLKGKIEIVRKALPGAARVAFAFEDIEVHGGCWDKDFDPSGEGDMRLRWSNVVVSGVFAGGSSIGWEFGIKHVDGCYEAYGFGETELDGLIRDPQDVWYDDRIQDEIDWDARPAK